MEGEGEGKGEGEKEKEKRFNGREFHHFPASGESNASYVSPPLSLPLRGDAEHKRESGEEERWSDEVKKRKRTEERRRRKERGQKL